MILFKIVITKVKYFFLDFITDKTSMICRLPTTWINAISHFKSLPLIQTLHNVFVFEDSICFFFHKTARPVKIESIATLIQCEFKKLAKQN